MRVILSRKGFDTGSGGTASPIVAGRPISLPIPTRRRSATTYDHLGLGEIVERVTRGKIARDHLCHEDPMFAGGQCLFGQCGAAQSHLRNRGVGIGDVFLSLACSPMNTRASAITVYSAIFGLMM